MVKRVPACSNMVRLFLRIQQTLLLLLCDCPPGNLPRNPANREGGREGGEGGREGGSRKEKREDQERRIKS